MSEKVNLTQKQADAIECAWTQSETGLEIMNHHIAYIQGQQEWVGKELEPLRYMSLDQVVRAVYVGYEVEQTPEDKVRDMYELHFDDGERSLYDAGYNEGIQFGVKQTLELLGHKIDGINT